MSPSKRTPVNRREFIQGSALAGTGVATAGVLGSFVPATASAAGVPDRWDEEADVVVVGTGFAGLGAAIEAHDAGAAVMVIEKENRYGGNSLLARGSMQYPANHIQKAAGIEDRPEWAYEDIMKMGEYRNARELVRLFVDNAADTALWLEKLGIVWNKQPSIQEGCRVPRSLTPVPSPNYPQARGISEVTVLHRAATETRKVPIRLGCKMTRIIRADAVSPVAGIEVFANGKTISIRARRAVILATGGFKANHQMIRALDPRLDEPLSWSGDPYVHTVGDGHFAAAAVGAGFVDMSFVCEFAITIGSSRYVVWDPQAMTSPIGSGGLPFATAGQPYMILVDNDGNRYVNEATFATSHVTWNGEYTVAYLNLPKRPRTAWMIADAEGAGALTWSAAALQNADPATTPYLDPKLVGMANTLEALAARIGVPAANLGATINRYNGYVPGGIDGDFKRPAPLHALRTPPFYAARAVLIAHDQCGGIRVNARLQVIDQTRQAETGTGPSVALNDERVIPHLYAAGECAGGLYGADRGPGKIGSYLVQGRFAGRHAALEQAV